MPSDLIVFGPHPDDIEIGLGGVVARHAAEGRSVGLCDLTRGELGSNGTPEIRAREAEEARRVLGAAWRENLRWPDGAITNTPEALQPVIEMIRRHRPKTIAIPYWQDRHPDHMAASEALTLAAFKSGLRRVPVDGDPWRPEWVCYYFINDSVTPSFVVDVSDYYERKRAAVACYRSQFAADGADAVGTRLTSPVFRQLVESRDAQFGALAGVAFAEGLVVREPLLRSSLLKNLE
jgi:bacillithiol biosynthesis deacetylase BshB1